MMHSRLLAYLQLIRLPTVFTAMADIVLGFVLTHGFLYGPDLDPVVDYEWQAPVHFVQPAKFIGLLIASCCLYLSGMVFNDVFDRKQDAEERPGRPIPSGRVPLRNAVVLGCGLMLAGLISAATVSLAGLQVGLLLVAAILGYDSYFKRTALGPVFMGSCRFLNVMLGSSADFSSLASVFAMPQIVAALGLGTYIVGLTVFARTEARESNRWQLGFAQLIFNLGFAILAWLIFNCHPQRVQQQTIHIALALLAVVAFTVNRRAVAAVRNPGPTTVQLCIKVMLLSYVILDATLVYWYLGGANAAETRYYATAHAMTTASLVIPAMILSRTIPMT